VVFASFSGTRKEDRPPGENGSGATVFVSCFINSASFDSETWLWVIVIVGVLAVIFAPLKRRNSYI